MKKLAYGLIALGLLAVIFLAVMADAEIKTSTHILVMASGVAVAAGGVFGGQMLLNEVEYRERKKK